MTPVVKNLLLASKDQTAIDAVGPLSSSDILESILVDGEDLCTLVMAALRRGKIIATATPQNADYRKRVYVRQRDRDHDANQARACEARTRAARYHHVAEPHRRQAPHCVA